jgi:hypothetical protein
MGTCTSAARHRQKQQHHQQHNRTVSKNPVGLDIKPPPPLPPLPITAFPKQKVQYPQSLYTDFDILSSFLTKPIFHPTDTNSLIQLYSSNTNNNNNNNNNNSTIINWMSSSTSSVTHIPPRIPVPKTRLPVYQSSQSQQTTVNIRPKSEASTVLSNNQTGNITIKNDFIVYFHWTILSFFRMCRCYQYHSHLVRITETNLYEVSYFLYTSFFLSLSLSP